MENAQPGILSLLNYMGAFVHTSSLFTVGSNKHNIQRLERTHEKGLRVVCADWNCLEGYEYQMKKGSQSQFAQFTFSQADN